METFKRVVEIVIRRNHTESFQGAGSCFGHLSICILDFTIKTIFYNYIKHMYNLYIHIHVCMYILCIHRIFFTKDKHTRRKTYAHSFLPLGSRNME